MINRLEIAAQADSTDSTLSRYRFESIEITGRRSQTVSSSISRIISVIRKDEIERQGLSSFTDILEYLSNADIRQRGAMGIQTDISLRGSSFDHVMILVNGIDLSDPQTGHLSTDIPIDPEAIERIEILEGPAARSLGPGAFMGAVNLITKRGDVSELSAGQLIGDFGLVRTKFSGGIKAGLSNHFLSASRSASSGYMHNTDHELYNVYYHADALVHEIQFDIQGGYQNKHFGASGFYSPRFPGQYEENNSYFGSLKVKSGNKIKISNHVFWKHRNDHFMLDRDNPSFYENFHLTDVYGGQVNLTFPVKDFIWNGGIDIRAENILSNNIGFEIPVPVKVKGTDSAYYNRQYQRTNFSLFAEQVYHPGNWDITIGFMLNRNTGFHDKLSFFPGIEIGYTTDGGYTAFVNFNRALHLPTFTDLFYSDPFNQGNLNLDPDRLISAEGGIKYARQNVRYQLSGFFNTGNDIIDWLWNYENNRFSPVNVESLIAKGFTSVISADLGKTHSRIFFPAFITLNYQYLSEDKSTSSAVSKYYSLKHKLSATFSLKFLNSGLLTWKVSYQDRNGDAIGYKEPDGYFPVPYDPYWLLDGIIKWSFRYFELYSEASNILNTKYIDAGYIYQPGRWFRIGINFRKHITERGTH